MKNIINLHNHTHYSALDALSTPKLLVDKAIEHGVNSIAITDHGNMNNWGNFYLYAKSKNIKPILGCEFYIIEDLEEWKKLKLYYEENKSKDKEEKKKILSKLRQRNHLIILVKNLEGFETINQLIYESYNNFYYRPRIDKKLLEKYNKGLICSSACLAGEIQQYIINKDFENAEKTILWYKNLFKEDFYLEIQFNELKEQHDCNLKLIELGKKFGIKIIITADSHYVNKDDQTTHQTLLLLQSKQTYTELNNKDAWEFSTKGLFVKNREEFWNDCQKYNLEIDKEMFNEFANNTFEIDSKIEEFEINKELKLKDMMPEIKNKDEYLFNFCIERIKEKKLNDIYIERLKFETDIIKQKKFANYFLTVSKIVNDAKKEMIIGCARGSGGGCLINYLLGITEIDPIKYDLLFHRFLSIERMDPPDIDIDFENNDKVKNDLMKKFGNDVACVTNYNTFQILGLIKDLCRTYEIYDIKYLNSINKKIDLELQEAIGIKNEESDIDFDLHNIEDLINSSPTFKKFIYENKILENDLKKLIGKIKHIGKHAAGVIVCDNLIKKMPTMIIKETLQTSLNEGANERLLTDFGFVKIDVLGLKTLGVIHKCLNLIGLKNNKSGLQLYNELLHPDKLNLNDKKIYENIFHNFNLLGIFQFETDSMKSMIDKVKPNCFEDLIAINALFRPGPLSSGVAYEYGDRKRGIKPENYYNNDIVKKILSKTFGLLCFQEDVMNLGKELGDLTLAETNMLRKLLMKTKKGEIIDEKLEKLRIKFFEGAKNKNMKLQNIEELWVNMINFAKYSFNKSHATGYAMIAYQCSYLKTYYPIEYYCSLLQLEDLCNYSKIINEMLRNNIKMNPLDLNKSGLEFKIFENEVYFGFSNIHGIGEKAANAIIQSKNNKNFEDFFDFITRDDINWRQCNKKIVETLLKIGVFGDDYYYKQMIYEEYNKRKGHLSKKQSLWGNDQKNALIEKIKEDIKDNPKCSILLTNDQKMRFEKEFYKINFKYSPFFTDDKKEIIETLLNSGKVGGINSDKLYKLVQFNDIKRFNDKNGNEMCFIMMNDYIGSAIKGVIFSSLYNKLDIKDEGIYIVTGKNDGNFLLKTYKNILDFKKVLEENNVRNRISR